MPEFNDDAAIRKLIRTIARLMATVPEGWVSWRMVSREQQGTKEFADLLSSLSELPQYTRYLFSTETGGSN